MKVRNKWVIIPAIVLTLSVGTGTVFALSNDTPKEIKDTSHAKKEEPKVEPAAPIEEQPVQQAPAPVQAPAPAPAPTPKTPADLKEIGKQTILALGKAQSEVDCFIEVMGLRYDWNTLTEEFVRNKVTELYTYYGSTCGAVYMFKQPGRVIPQENIYPPGLRD